MSRRLGDDPLNRARAARAKAAEGSASVALDAGGQQRTAQVGSQASRASYNDVFYQRRGEGVAPVQAAVVQGSEAPEISEISEIPEIRDAASATASQPAFDATPAVEAAPTVAQAPPVSFIEEVVARMNSQAALAVQAVAPSPKVDEGPASPSTASKASLVGGDESTSTPQKGGFLKRLFGKFK